MSDLALRVRIGGDIKGLEKALKDAERAVQSASSKLSSWGNNLSMALTAPMLAFGAASLKAAGDIEALNKSMVAIFSNSGRSAEAAQEEVNALRKAAEAPGLDFEQAVKASIRLQGVGQSAGKARQTIIQLANAIATTGGTAEDLGEVVNQFSQMLGKGKILNEDIKIITGRLPMLAGLMKEAFGSTQADAIRAQGVTAEQFVDTLVKGMEKMKRVEGGISNAIVNAGTSIKMFLASVGESLNKTFNITGKLESFAKWLDGLSQRFSGMSEGTQRAIAAVGVFAVALGPMLKVGQGVVMIYGQVVAVFGLLQKALLQSLAGQAVPGAIAAFKALNLATKLTIVGAAVGVVLALAAAFAVLRKDTSEAAQTQQMINDITRSANESISEQKVRTSQLISILNGNNSSLEAKAAALKELNEISPKYFSGLKAEAIDVEALNRGYDAYIQNLLLAARVKAAEGKLIAIDQERLALAEKASRLLASDTGGKYNNMGLGQGNLSAQAKATKDQLLQELSEEGAALTQREQKINEFIKGNREAAETNNKLFESFKGVTDKTKGNTDASGGNTKAKKDQAKAWEEYMIAVHKADLAEKAIRGAMEYEDIKGANKPVDEIAGIKTPKAADPEFAAKFESGMARIKSAVNSASDSIKTDVEGIDVSMQRWADGFQQSIGEWPDRIGEALGALSGLSDAMAARNISNLNKEMEARLVGVKSGSAQELKIKEDFANKIEQVQRRAARRAKVLAVLMATIDAAQGVLKGLAQGFIPGAIAAGAIGAIQIAKIIATPLAKGGIVSGPTHALVGEYPGARNNPEVVAPLDKLKGMLGGTGSDVNVHGTFRVQGPDLLLVLEKAQRQRGRANGF